jgi:para-aminobenzoate synthetase/4-amino-4-deoxychorismate lyase
MKVIASLEATRREVYTGAIGIASPIAGLDLNVAIRTFEVSGSTIWLGAGGAVVADSEPERELSEAFDKAAGPVAAIGGQLVRTAGRGRVAGRAARRARAALAYGERPDSGLGVFETVLVEHGRPVGLERHLTRLAASVRVLYGATLPHTLEAGVLAAAAQAVDAPRARLRVLADPEGAVRITVSPAAARGDEPVALHPFVLPGGLGAHKWRDRRLLEALATAARGAVPLLLDTDGHVLEAAHANVWVVDGGELITAPADGRILPGTEREALLAADPFAREEPLSLARLAEAEAVFLTSSISGRHPARLVPEDVPGYNSARLEVRS